MKNIFIVLVCLFVSFEILAQVRQKDSHEHGAANLKMVVEGRKLQFEFEVPSESLIGFEHFPNSQRNRDNFNEAIKILSAPSRLFSMSSKAECLLVGMNVSQSLFPNEDGHDESETSEIHSEFKSNYYWNCQHLDEIGFIGIQLMTFFPKIDEIQVNWISNNGQGALELESEDDQIKGWE